MAGATGDICRRLFTLKLRLAFLQKGGGPFLHIFRIEAFSKRLLLEQESITQSTFFGKVGAFDDLCHGDRRFLRDDTKDLL